MEEKLKGAVFSELPSIELNRCTVDYPVEMLHGVKDDRGNMRNIALEWTSDENDTTSKYCITVDGEEQDPLTADEDTKVTLTYFNMNQKNFFCRLESSVDEAGNEQTEQIILYTFQDGKLMEKQNITEYLRERGVLFSDRCIGKIFTVQEGKLYSCWQQNCSGIGACTIWVPLELSENGDFVCKEEFEVQYGGMGLQGNGVYSVLNGFSTSKSPGGEKDGSFFVAGEAVSIIKMALIDTKICFLLQTEE